MFWGKNMSNNGVFSIIVCICQQIKDHQYGTEAYCERPRVLYATGLHGVRPFGICYRLWKKARGKDLPHRSVFQDEL